MNKYVALLRGINISGKNKISMPELRASFEAVGFINVKTYINSGNIIFEVDNDNMSAVKTQCEAIIRSVFNLEIPVKLVAVDHLNEVIEQAPEWWNKDKDAVNYAIFVLEPTSIEEVFDAVGAIKPEYEQIDYYKDVIFWATPLKTFQKSQWSKIASSTANNKVTIRNANTVNKLLELAK